MPDSLDLDAIVASAHVDHEVYALRPDYRALLIAVDGLVPAPSDAVGEALLVEAESAAREQLSSTAPEQLPHVAAWREAYRAFGAKPQRTRPSVEALLRRTSSGLPRINRLTDVYNAVSVLHNIPIGGEDLTHYVGAPRLVRAVGDEPFDTTSQGEPATEFPEPGEVVWRDDDGVTCRRWNWRQCSRTQLTGGTTAALFILDALAPMTPQSLSNVSELLCGHLARLGTDVRIATRLLSGEHPTT
jgi:DNA/RNA-binding domain of Phe-tRNA-synthetase-like protein